MENKFDVYISRSARSGKYYDDEIDDDTGLPYGIVDSGICGKYTAADGMYGTDVIKDFCLIPVNEDYEDLSAGRYLVIFQITSDLDSDAMLYLGMIYGDFPSKSWTELNRPQDQRYYYNETENLIIESRWSSDGIFTNSNSIHTQNFIRVANIGNSHRVGLRIDYETFTIYSYDLMFIHL